MSRAGILVALLFSFACWAEPKAQGGGPRVKPNAVSTLSVTGSSGAQGSSSVRTPEIERRRLNLDRFTALLISFYRGPNVTELDSGETFDRNGQPIEGSTQPFFNDFTALYQFTDTYGMRVGPYVPFNYIGASDEDREFAWGDVGLRYVVDNVIPGDGIGGFSSFYLQLPTSDFTRESGADYVARFVPLLFHKLKSAPIMWGTWLEGRANVNADSGPLYKAYYSPFVRYSQNDKFHWQILYEGEAYNYVGDRAWRFRAFQNDWQPGIVWNPSRFVEINPYLQVFADQGISVKKTGIGAFLAVKSF